MRVTYLINQYPMVSHSFIRREIQALEEQGIEVQRIALRGWSQQIIDSADSGEREKTRYVLRDGVARLAWAALVASCTRPLRFISALLLALRSGYHADRPALYHLIYLAEACRIVPWLERPRTHHVHAHFGTNSAEVAMLAGVLSGVGYSFTVHGPEEFDKPEFIKLAEKIRRSRFVVAISSFGKGQLLRWIPLAQWDKVKVVHCGLGPEFYQEQPAPMPSRARLACIGRLSEQKGQLLLIEAASLLASKGIDFELVLGGDGPMRPHIEALARHHGLQNRIRITGWLSGAQVREEIRAARALVLPSFAEGLPVVIMEAMALGRPVLTTQIAGIPELVRHGENGWLFACGSLPELAAAMESCLAMSPEQLARLGAAGRMRVLERHDARREASKLATLFKEMAQPAKQESPALVMAREPAK